MLRAEWARYIINALSVDKELKAQEVSRELSHDGSLVFVYDEVTNPPLPYSTSTPHETSLPLSPYPLPYPEPYLNLYSPSCAYLSTTAIVLSVPRP